VVSVIRRDGHIYRMFNASSTSDEVNVGRPDDGWVRRICRIKGAGQ
jgi:hypothetical protein